MLKIAHPACTGTNGLVSNSPINRRQVAATLSLVAAPVGWLQGRRVRRDTPRLDEAPGERSGSIAGSHPPITLLGLGESPMAAVGLAKQAEGVVARLADRLAAMSGRRVVWQTAAESGATARDARQRLLPRLEASPGGFVIVGLGVNDCLALRSARAWRAAIRKLVDAIGHRLHPRRIILTGVPPMQHFPSLPFPLSAMLGARASLLDAVCQRLAEHEAGIVHVPMAVVDSPGNLFCRDGFHPNARAHREWAKQLAPIIQADL